MYDGYHFVGMHLVWWFIWIIFVFTMFGWYQPVPRRKNRETSPLDILQKRFAAGEINKETYQEHREILQKDPAFK